MFLKQLLWTCISSKQTGFANMGARATIPRNACLLMGLLYMLAGLAWAHAIIVESTPKMNAVVTGPALEIKLRFNVRIDGDRSKLTLVLPDGGTRPVDLPRQPAPDSLSATVPQLSPGNYKLHWQVLANDGHITQGDIPFRMADH